MPTLTSPSTSSIIRVSSGAPTTDSTVTPPSSVTDRVSSRRKNPEPRSASSRSARVSTGTTSEVSTAPRTISVMRLGSVLAVLNADAIAGDSAAPIMTVRRNPVIRLSRVATAMEPVERTTSASEVSRRAGGSSRSVVASAVPAPPVLSPPAEPEPDPEAAPDAAREAVPGTASLTVAVFSAAASAGTAGVRAGVRSGVAGAAGATDVTGAGCSCRVCPVSFGTGR